MKSVAQRIIWVCLASILLAACGQNQNTSSDRRRQAQPLSFEQTVETFSSDHASLNLPDLDLSFVANLQALGSEDALREQQEVFEGQVQALKLVNSDALDICSRIELSVMRSEAAFGLRQAELGLRFLTEATDLEAATRLLDVPLGAEWYDFYLDRWNGADLDPDKVFAFGEHQLQSSVAEYDALQRELGFDGDDAGLARHLTISQLRLDGGEQTMKLFSERQERIWNNLARLFPDTYGVGPANIVRSDRGASFPVPGYYEIDEKTFYYNLVEEGFEARQADWLLLHEGTPGHHFQISAQSGDRRCTNRLPELFHAAYIEGWAAYAETLGEALGLYKTPEAQLAAVEWDMVRSVRVVLDVAINAYGWGDEQALAYWRDHVRGQDDIAQREIDRMKRWPAQVVTYKYGANAFEAVRSEYAGDADAIKIFHNIAIGYGPMPLATFEALYPELARHAIDPIGATEN